MLNGPGTYERTRDDIHYPTCWHTSGNTCAPHFHSALELNYVQTETLEALVDGRAVTVGAGELLVVPSYAVHRFVAPPELVGVVLIIPLDYIQAFQRQMTGRRFSEMLLHEGPHTREIVRSMRLLAGRSDDKGESYVVRGQIYTILGLLLELIPLASDARGGRHGQVRDVLDYLHKHYRQPVSLSRLALEFGYSESRISHAFNENVGCSIPEYLGALRSRAAASALLEEGSSCTTVAMNAGFDSMRTFYRCFKRCFGMTPTQFLQARTVDERGTSLEVERKGLLHGRESLKGVLP